MFLKIFTNNNLYDEFRTIVYILRKLFKEILIIYIRKNEIKKNGIKTIL